MVRRRIILLCHLCLVLVAVFSVADAFFANTSSFFEKFRGGGNSLWDELYEKCGNRASFNCVQGRLMNYINNTLDSDLRITDGIYFVKSSHQQANVVLDSSSTLPSNTNNTNKGRRRRTGRAVNTMTTVTDNEISNSTHSYAQIEEDQEEERVEIEDDHDDRVFDSFVRTVEKIEDDLDSKPARRGKSMNWTSDETGNNRTQEEYKENDSLFVTSLNKVTDILYDKTTNYLSSHDLRLDLPRFMFGGSRMVISPRGVDADGGILVKLNFNPVETPRNSIGKYFHKMFKKKLLTSFLALLLIIKLIKIKLMYVLPVIIGVNSAKKLLLKTLLFLFPPLVHLFKLCTFYHAHASKLHFHHHKIKHHHHHIKVPVPVPVPVPSHKPHHPDGYIGADEYDAASPVILDDHDHGHLHSPYEPIPSYGHPDYYTRNDMTNQHGDELDSWGLKDFYASTESPGVLSAQAQAYSPYAEQNYKLLQAVPGAASKQYATVTQKKSKGSSNTWKSKTGNLGTKNTILVPFDPFYSPILQKIDSIFTGLGFNEEGCRERLICSMYKDPLRFSPHSNLLSTELSRDPTELERPSATNLAAVRFYRYVEAARDGQSQKDCLMLYSDCVVKTE